jgi:HAD superfamily hydrolase (TIGR01509 family)
MDAFFDVTREQRGREPPQRGAGSPPRERSLVTTPPTVTVTTRYELVIFDNDGVVVDSELLANRVLADLLTEHGIPMTLEESVAEYMGGTLGTVREHVWRKAKRELPAAFDDDYHERLFAAFESDLRPVPGIERVLSNLDIAYCLASSGTIERIERSLTRVGLREYFGDRVFSAEQVERGKPAPDLFLLAASEMGAQPSNCVVVEDSPNGVAAARAAGMTVLGFAGLTPVSRLTDAHRCFASMEELSGLLNARSSST